MPIETRYMRRDLDVLTSNHSLFSSYGSFSDGVVISIRDLFNIIGFSLGIRVFKINNLGFKLAELTSGTPVAIVSRSVDGWGYLNNTWDCLGIAMDVDDRILVEVWRKWSTSAIWGILQPCGVHGLPATFNTEALGGDLNASTWDVYYYNSRSWDGTRTYLEYLWDTSNYLSRVENFSYEAGALVAPTSRGDGLTWIVSLLNKSKKPLRRLPLKGFLRGLKT